jgi:pimeloyl-ACP methyl ester carboxylesterase
LVAALADLGEADVSVEAPPTLVFVPGLLCDAATWTLQIEALAGRHRCVVVDHGRADSLTVMAEQALAQAGAERFALIGHSMGGRVAMEMLRLAPERIERVALLDTSWHPVPEGREGDAERRMRLGLLALAQREGMVSMARNWAQGMVHPQWHASAVFETIVAMLGRKTPEHYAAQIHALLNRPDASPVLRGVRCPTLLLCGADDHWSTPERHEQMRGFMPHATLDIVPDCGHMSTMESPAAVTASLARWLA